MDNSKATVSFHTIFFLLLFIVVVPFLPLLIAQRWNWGEAWIYALLSIVAFIGSRVWASKRHPDIIAERAHFLQHDNAKDWDRRITILLGVAGTGAMILAGLDQLFAWSPSFTTPMKITALIFMIAGYILSSYALVENRFFSDTVRLQTDRGHKVISSGPYRWMRHPGYAGTIMVYLATPILLDSYWTILPAITLAILMIWRTSMEDRFLQSELDGYRLYASRVRYRLFPGIW